MFLRKKLRKKEKRKKEERRKKNIDDGPPLKGTHVRARERVGRCKRGSPMGVSEPRYSAHHAYGVVQVQVQVDLQVGQRPVETFFRIRGERMEEGAANVAVNEEKEGRSGGRGPVDRNLGRGIADSLR